MVVSPAIVSPFLIVAQHASRSLRLHDSLMNNIWPQLEFLQPAWLLALGILPLVVWVFRWSLVDLPKRQMWASLVVRTIIIALLICALAEATLLSTTHRVFTVFAVDESLSVGVDGRTTAERFVKNATTGISSDRYAIIEFARSPRALEQLSADATATDEASNSSGNWKNGTNLQTAMELATAGIPAEFIPHIVLLTDGNENFGSVGAAISTSTVRVSVVPLTTRTQPELQVSDVLVPRQVAESSPFNIEVVVNANHDDEATIEIFQGEYRTRSERIKLSTGENRFTFSEEVDRPTQFTARITRGESAGADSRLFMDTLLDNNTASGLVYVTGKSRVLLIERIAESAQPLQWALTEEGIQVDVRPPQALPEVLTELQDYDVVMLSNIPANDLSTKKMDVLRAFVRDVGGGLIMLGGDESFGLGGYYKTIVEDVLPVSCDFEKEKENPGLAMVLVIDKSGSMGGQKLELAKDAASATVELLGDKDQIAVLAFDGKPHWVSRMMSASQKSSIIDKISGIELGGGTTLYPAMQEAFRTLQATTAKLKHVIILTDGHSTPGDFEGIARDMAAQRITVSTVGLGDVDENILRRIAEIGNGRNYLCTDATSVPQIFAKETITASQSALNEDPFLALVARATQVLEGVDLDEAPFLLGYVVTKSKPTSEVILVHPETHAPLLSWWRYGLGMSVAFTSDAKSRWAADWLAWDGYNKFWAQVVRHCLKKSDDRGLTFDIEHHGDVAQVVVDATDTNGLFLNEATTTLTVVGPSLEAQTLLIPQTAPGRYSRELPMASAGAWNLQVTQTVNNEIVHQQSRGFVVGYPEELRIRDTNEGFLRTIAKRTGGAYQPTPQSVFDPLPADSASRTLPLWPWLLGAAVLLFVVDVALRRLDLSSIFGSDVYRSDIRS